MILFGASGHGRVVQSALSNCELYFDDDLSKTYFNGVRVESYKPSVLPNSKLLITIGDNKYRMLVSVKVKHSFGNLLQKTSIVDESVVVGEGSQILHNSVIQSGTVVGKHSIINTSASIDHDCHIDDFVHIAPNATICGNVSISQGVLIGAAAVVLPGIKIGEWAVIGAGSVITKNVKPHTVVYGNPAKQK